MEIRRCFAKEVPALMQFLGEHWQANHVLSTSRALMDWQHGAADGSYDYLIADNDGEIIGVLGYIATRRYDAALYGERNVLWLALWKVREDIASPGLGLRLLRELGRVEPHGVLAVNGINLTHPPMYRALGYQVGELQQFFVVNPAMAPSLIEAPAGFEWPVPAGGEAMWTEMSASQLETLEPDGPWLTAGIAKTPSYFLNRFLRHPFYEYRVHLLTLADGGQALLASRVVESQGCRVLRLVDFSGNTGVLSQLGAGLQSLMAGCKAAYADFWVYGVDGSELQTAGFQCVDPEGEVIVPNYFEPFLARNGRILCALKVQNDVSPPVMVVRADGDQDRPNQLEATA